MLISKPAATTPTTTEMAFANCREARAALARLTAQAPTRERKGETTAAGSCFRRVTAILAGKERK